MDRSVTSVLRLLRRCSGEFELIGELGDGAVLWDSEREEGSETV